MSNGAEGAINRVAMTGAKDPSVIVEALRRLLPAPLPPSPTIVPPDLFVLNPFVAANPDVHLYQTMDALHAAVMASGLRSARILIEREVTLLAEYVFTDMVLDIFGPPAESSRRAPGGVLPLGGVTLTFGFNGADSGRIAPWPHRLADLICQVDSPVAGFAIPGAGATPTWCLVERVSLGQAAPLGGELFDANIPTGSVLFCSNVRSVDNAPLVLGGADTQVFLSNATKLGSNWFSGAAPTVFQLDSVSTGAGGTLPERTVGTLAQRPALADVPQGFMYFATNSTANGQPLWSNGVAWVDAAGVIVP